MAAKITRTESTAPSTRSPRWWHFGMVWFVISGPAIVVVAGFATMVVAFRHADTELHELTPVAALSVRIGAQPRTPPALAPAADPGRAPPPPGH